MYATTQAAANAVQANVHNSAALQQVTNTCALLTQQHTQTQLNSYANEQLYTIALRSNASVFEEANLLASNTAIIAMHNSSDEWEFTTTFANAAQANDYLNTNIEDLQAFNALVIIEL